MATFTSSRSGPVARTESFLLTEISDDYTTPLVIKCLEFFGSPRVIEPSPGWFPGRHVCAGEAGGF
jgi:hypothetical protein